MKKQARPVGLRVPSGTPTITLFYGTEDETTAKIYGVKTNKPYAKLYGVKYYLTEQEIKNLEAMLGAFKK